MGRIRVAVTGAAGQVGSALVRRMQKYNHIDVIAICRNVISAAVIHSVAPKCDIRMGSITDIDAARKLLGDCEVIVNCALAMVSGRPRDSRLLNKAMIDSFSNVKKLKSLIHLSSVSVYGGIIDSVNLPRSTFESPRPDNDYGRSKLYIEQYAKGICLSKKLEYYILRLGHVIGAEMDRSRQIIELVQDTSFQLPFDGEVPSNAIHVERLAVMIIDLLSSSIPPGTYNVAEKQETWRKVFDWHTQALGFPPVKGMSRDKSLHLKAFYSSRSIKRDIINWLGSLPILTLVTYPSILEFAFRALTIMPSVATSRLATLYKCRNVRKQIRDVNRHGNKVTSPYLFSDAMPGKYLELPSGVVSQYPSEDELSIQLRKWFNKFSKPRWLPNKICLE